MPPITMAQGSQWAAAHDLNGRTTMGAGAEDGESQEPFILRADISKPKSGRGRKSSPHRGHDNGTNELPEDDELDDETHHMFLLPPAMDDDIDSPLSARPQKKIQNISDVPLSPGMEMEGEWELFLGSGQRAGVCAFCRRAAKKSKIHAAVPTLS